MRVICINASNKPKSIPVEQWIKEGEVYTVVRVVRLSLQQDKLGLILKEVQLANCFPYEFYDSERFTPVDDVKEEKEEVEEIAKEVDLDLVS